MRTLSAAHAAQLTHGHFRVRVSVRDAGGTFRDLTTVAGFNAVRSVRWTESVDSPGMTADVELWRNLDAISFSPLHDASPLNRATPFDAAAALSALVDLNRRLRIEWALEADATAAPTWHLAFDGLVESFSLDSGESMSIGARGQYAELQDRIFEEEYVFAIGGALEAGAFRVWQPSTAYATGERVIPGDGKANGRHYTVSTAGTSGATEPTWPTSGTVASGSAVFAHAGTTSPTGGYQVQNVLTQMALSVIPAGSAIFGDLSTTIAVYTPTSPGWAINVFQVRRESVWNALVDLAQQIGWDLRWRWSNADSAFRLTLYDPNRSKTVPDRVLALSDVRSYEAVDLDIANIRNVVRVVYSDAGDLDAQQRARRKQVNVVDTTSAARFGRRFMEVAEGSASSIDSPGEATTMANAMLSDLASPVAEVGVRMRFFPWVELTDLLGLPADGRRFTTQQNLAVTSYEHSWSAGGACETRVGVRGKPSSGWYRWGRVSGGANPTDVHRLVDRGNAGAFSLTHQPALRGQNIQVAETPLLRALARNFELHVSATPSFTATSATLQAAGQQQQMVVQGLKPGRTHYAKAFPYVWNQSRVVRGEPSEETSFVAGYVEPADLNPETVPVLLPPNGDFEGWFDGASSPPDHWSVGTGSWANDFARITDRASGAYAVEVRDAGSSVRAELVGSWFPVSPGRTYSLDAMLKKFGSSDGDVRLTLEWGDTSKAATGTALEVTMSTNGLSTWTKTPTWVVDAPSGAVWARVKVGRHASGTYRFGFDAVSVRAVGEALRTPAYAANWADYGAGFTGGAYWRDAMGLVRLRGLVLTSVVRAANSVIFTLPVGFRPLAQEVFTQSFGGAGAYMRVDVAANGEVRPQQALAINEWVSLSGIVFDTR